MTQKISLAMYHLINVLFITAMMLTFYGVVNQGLFNPLILTNGVWVAFLIFVLAMMLILGQKSLRKLAQCCLSFVWSKRQILGPLSFVMLIVLQIGLIKLISAPIGWDVGRLFISNVDLLLEGNPNHANIYLSMNPNNSFFFFMMHHLSLLAEKFSSGLGSSWLFWQGLNTVFLDLGILILFFAARTFYNEKLAYLVAFLASFSLMLSPWVLVPYTDIFSFLLQALLLLLASQVLRSHNMLVRIVLSLALGFVIAVSFLTKPTNLIILIAALLIMAFKFIEKPKRIGNFGKSHILAVGIMILVSLATLWSFDTYKERQNIVTYDESAEKIWPLFIMMGLKDDGGYDSNDSNYISSIPGRSEKYSEANRIIQERLETFELGEISQFMLQKHFNNTDRGDFGWGKDGVNQIAATPATSNFQIKLRDTYYQDGTRSNNLRYYMQLMWGITLLGILITGVKPRDEKVTLILKLAILGAFMYLLIFEGGRSRYLIQFLPLFYTLSGIGWHSYLNQKGAI